MAAETAPAAAVAAAEARASCRSPWLAALPFGEVDIIAALQTAEDPAEVPLLLLSCI